MRGKEVELLPYCMPEDMPDRARYIACQIECEKIC
jgi:hypothetical protein